jgi:cell filamentation protein, protein adenylyltransferase
MKTEIHKCRATSRVITPLTAISETIGKLEGVKLQSPDPTLRRKHRIQTIQSSLSIEGNSLTRDQVTALFDNKRVIGLRQEILEVQNAIRAYRQLAAFNPLSIVSFQKAHGILMEGLVSSAGALRKEPIGVLRSGDIFHEAPQWNQVEPMMQTLFSYLKTTDDHLLLKSCRCHFQLEHIHPFVDGNGRVGRLWQTRILMDYHPIFEFLPVEELIKERQSDYYQELATGDDTGDCTGFIVLMLTLIRESLEDLFNATRSVTLTAANRLELAAQSFSDHSFGRKDYQAIFKTISTATASRDLQLGVKKGLLDKTGDRRTATYRFNAAGMSTSVNRTRMNAD